MYCLLLCLFLPDQLHVLCLALQADSLYSLRLSKAVAAQSGKGWLGPHAISDAVAPLLLPPGSPAPLLSTAAGRSPHVDLAGEELDLCMDVLEGVVHLLQLHQRQLDVG